jgi:predicted metal-dependent hydrolase
VSNDPAQFREHFLQGVTLFNREDFFGAHEEWELLWIPANGETREFLQGLIQLSAAFHHVQRGNERGATRLFASAAARLRRNTKETFGVNAALLAGIAEERAEGEGDRESFPKILLVPSSGE